MGWVRVYLTQALRRRVRESWDKGDIVVSWPSNELGDKPFVPFVRYLPQKSFAEFPGNIGAAAKSCLDSGFLLVRHVQIALSKVSKQSALFSSGLMNRTKRDVLGAGKGSPAKTGANGCFGIMV